MINKNFSQMIFLLSAGIFCGSAAAVQVSATVDNSQPIYANSPFSYSIVVENGDSPDSVDLDALKNFSPSGPSIQNRTSVVNGRTSSSVILTYQLIAPAKGTATIPGINVEIKGQVYHTAPVTITVAEPGTTKQIDVETHLSTDKCYVGQPVVFMMSFYVWADIARNRAIANVTMDVPLLKNDSFYIEEADSQAMGGSQIALGVNGQKEILYQDQVQHNGVDCVRLQLVKILIPKQAGRFDVQAGSVSADIAVSKAQRRNSAFDDFFGEQYEYKRFSVSSKQSILNVSPLPKQGQPADFYGLVGNYTIQTSANPVKVNVGDPVTLTIRIGGEKFLKPVQWPELKNIAAFADNFKIPAERSAGQIQNDYKIFTQTIRANSEKVTQIPPIPLTYFDAKIGKYITIESKPIPLDVSPTKVVTQADVEGTMLTQANKEIEAVKEGLSANYTEADALQNQKFSPAIAFASVWFIVLWLIPLFLLLISVAVKIIFSSSPQRIIARKKKYAYGRAANSVRSAGKSGQKITEELTAALKQYVADKFERVAGSLTAEDCRLLIYQGTDDPCVADEFKHFMEEIEASAYSPTSYECSSEKQKQIVELLNRIEKKL